MTKRLQRKGGRLIYKLKHWHEGKVFYRKLLGLALLPANDITTAYRIVVDNASQDIKNKFHDLISYYYRWWLMRVKPENFSVYGKHRRTNNPMEAYHRILHQRMGEHPSIWQFVGTCKQMQCDITYCVT